jgi:hypothetical protein
MMTQTHLLAAAALLARPESPRMNAAVVAGAFLPDAAMFVFFAIGVAQGAPQQQLWDTDYWQPGWQLTFAIFNSFPVYAAFLIAGLSLQARQASFRMLTVFASAALLHVALDLPVHADDAHIHFWPLTDWRFHSPLSYWQTEHHARWVGAIESVLGLACAVIVTRRFRRIWVSALCVLSGLLYTLHAIVVSGLVPIP